jgi:hypothetical protein
MTYPGDFRNFLQQEADRRIPNKRLPWHNNPQQFCQKCIKWPQGKGLAPYQGGTMRDLAKHHRVAVRSLHGVGKTTTAALVVLWFAITREAAGVDWKIVTTAGAWRQLEKYLWPEIRKWARLINWEAIGVAGWRRGPFNEATELLKLSLNLRHGEAFAVASSDASYIEGAHATEILYIFDESKAIHEDIFDAAEGAFASGNAYALAQSTPGHPMGRFYDIHAHKLGYEDWKTRHITVEDGLKAGIVNLDWVEKRRRQWGEDSAIFQNRVLGNFAATDEDAVVPLLWVEAANERWYEITDLLPRIGKDTIDWSKLRMTDLGVDVARTGEDRTVLAPVHLDKGGNPIVGELRDYAKQGTMATAGQVLGILGVNEGVRAVIDVIGTGGGVYDRVREFGYPQTVGFVASGKCLRRDRTTELGFVNMRSGVWWNLREELDPDFGAVLALPPHDALIGDLCTPRWDVVSTAGGSILVEAKDDIRKRLKRSTDYGDAVVQARLWQKKRRRRARMAYGGSLHAA